VDIFWNKPKHYLELYSFLMTPSVLPTLHYLFLKECPKAN